MLLGYHEPKSLPLVHQEPSFTPQGHREPASIPAGHLEQKQRLMTTRSQRILSLVIHPPAVVMFPGLVTFPPLLLLFPSWMVTSNFLVHLTMLPFLLTRKVRLPTTLPLIQTNLEKFLAQGFVIICLVAMSPKMVLFMHIVRVLNLKNKSYSRTSENVRIFEVGDPNQKIVLFLNILKYFCTSLFFSLVISVSISKSLERNLFIKKYHNYQSKIKM